MIPWWVIVLVVVAIVMIVWFMKGILVARRCRKNSVKTETNVTEPETDINEDFEAGDADTNN
jgi:hypothetical protein